MTARLSALLPLNATKLERGLADAGALTADSAVIRDFHNPETCPAGMLPWLAWQWHVDGWEYAQTEVQQRALIASSWDLHKYKGTPWAVLTALRSIGYPHVRLTEWFQQNPARTPGTFRVTFPALPELQEPGTIARLRGLINAYKNTRSWFEIDVSLQPPTDDNPVNPPIQLDAGMGLASVAIAHIPNTPIRLPPGAAAQQHGAAFGPLLARIDGPARLPPVSAPAGARGAAVQVVHIGSLPPNAWRDWMPPTMPTVGAAQQHGAALGPLLAHINGPASLPPVSAPAGTRGAAVHIVHIGSLPPDAWRDWDMSPSADDFDADDFLCALRRGYETGFAPAWQSPELTSEQATAMWFDAILQHDANLPQ